MSDNQSISKSTNAQSSEPATARLAYREAYRKVLSEQITIDPAQLSVINIDVTTAYTTVIGALPRIMALRERAARLPEFEIANFDNLETYAFALMHAQGEYVSASPAPEALLALSEEGVALRDNLYSDAVALANRGVISAEPLKELRGAPGYKNLAEDLLGLSSLLRRSWDEIAARTLVTAAELDRAEVLSEWLLHAVATRENASSVLADAIQKRLLLFTLFVNAYAQVRRAISFLRWLEEDLEEIAPSLYAGRARRKAEPEPPATPSATPGPTASDQSHTDRTLDQTPAPASLVGLPQSNPFAPPTER